MLNISNISKTFNPGTVNEKRAISGLSLHLAPGDFVTIIGSNGAGKSTLFNAICGDFLTDAGSIVLNGRDITFTPAFQRARRIGRLFQDPMRGSAPGMTIEENLALAAGSGGWLSHVSQGDKKRFRDRLALLDMGLEDRMKQPVGLLSGGQRQALTLLMSTMNPPSLLLLDEHTAALDPGTAEKVLKLTRDIVAEHKITTMMVTHNMQQALELGNRTLMMDSGSIVLDISGKEREGLTGHSLLVVHACASFYPFRTCWKNSRPARAKIWITTGFCCHKKSIPHPGSGWGIGFTGRWAAGWRSGCRPGLPWPGGPAPPDTSPWTGPF